MGRVLLYCATVFLSAFLLFQVQPVIGKFILPWFGSTPGVWTTCMLFFQVLLLGGYAYAHLLVSRLSVKRQAILHGVLLLLALVALPITPSIDWAPESGEAPVQGILLVLALSVGVPYMVLSSTGPLLQGWFSRLHPGRSPYWLYALSNVGSLLALISYPLFVEPEVGLQDQTVHWSIGFGVFALLAAGCAYALYRGARDVSPEATLQAEAASGAAPRWGSVLLWFSLSATGSAMLLATTNQMCLDIAVVPFLWIVPLALYLLSFVFVFGGILERVYFRPLFLILLPLVLWNAYGLLAEGVDADIGEQVVGYALALFVGCMCCHGELSRSKPAPRYLTFFFLIVSIGGAAGGLLVALVAHNVFDDFYEFPVLLCVTYGIVLIGVFHNAGSEPRRSLSAVGLVLRGLATLGVLGVVIAVTTELIDPETWVPHSKASKFKRATEWFDRIRLWLWLPVLVVPLLAEQQRLLRGRRFGAWWSDLRVNLLVATGIIASIGLVGFIGASGWIMRKPEATVIASGRNFYGTLAIKEYFPKREDHDWTLRHGRIMHGFQMKKHPGWPTSYYGPESGVGIAVQYHPLRWQEGRPFRIGVVGLGTGTIAAYANARVDSAVRWENRSDYAQEQRRVPGDVVRYYEINPMVEDWAWEHFTFLSDARKRGADAEVYLGDARLVMQRQLERGEFQRFDVLAIDAFSSDAIPIHLLTKESFDVYWGHLEDDGVLAIHVTNRFIELKPVVRRLAESIGKSVVHVDNRGDDRFGVDSSDWMVITSNKTILRQLDLVSVDLAPAADELWTDDYSSVWKWVKYDHEVKEARDWLPFLGLERDFPKGLLDDVGAGLRSFFGGGDGADDSDGDDGDDEDDWQDDDDDDDDDGD